MMGDLIEREAAARIAEDRNDAIWDRDTGEKIGLDGTAEAIRALAARIPPQPDDVAGLVKSARTGTGLGEKKNDEGHTIRDAWVHDMLTNRLPSVIEAKAATIAAFEAQIAEEEKAADYWCKRHDEVLATNTTLEARIAAAEFPDRKAMAARIRMQRNELRLMTVQMNSTLATIRKVLDGNYALQRQIAAADRLTAAAQAEIKARQSYETEDASRLSSKLKRKGWHNAIARLFVAIDDYLATKEPK